MKANRLTITPLTGERKANSTIVDAIANAMQTADMTKHQVTDRRLAACDRACSGLLVVRHAAQCKDLPCGTFATYKLALQFLQLIAIELELELTITHFRINRVPVTKSWIPLIGLAIATSIPSAKTAIVNNDPMAMNGPIGLVVMSI